MSSNKDTHEEPEDWYKMLNLDEDDMALAAEILGLPHSIKNNEVDAYRYVADQTQATLPMSDLSISNGQHNNATFTTNNNGPELLEDFGYFGSSTRDFAVPGADQLPLNPISSTAPLPQHEETPVDMKALVAQEGSDWIGYISSHEQYLRFKDMHLQLNNESSYGYVLDFPSNTEGQRELVRQLYHAMRNMDGILDGTRLNRKRKRLANDQLSPGGEQADDNRFEDSVAVKRVKETSPVELEILSWDLLFAIRDAQQGQDSIPGWSKDWERKQYRSFMDRFQEVILSLTKAKTVVSSLLNVSFMKRLAAAPERELHRKKDNKKLNMDRDISVKAGNYARKQGLVNVNENNGIKTASGQEIAPPNPLGNNLTNDDKNGTRRTRSGNMVNHLGSWQDLDSSPIGAFTPDQPTIRRTQGMLPPMSPAMEARPTTLTDLQLQTPMVADEIESELNTVQTLQTDFTLDTPVSLTTMHGYGSTGFANTGHSDLTLFPEVLQSQTKIDSSHGHHEVTVDPFITKGGMVEDFEAELQFTELDPFL